MSNSTEKLASTVTRLSVNNKNIYLVGTAHVSKKSVEDVKETIEKIEPDSVCVELCSARYKSIMQRDNWKNMDIFKIVKEKKAVLLLAQLIMSSFYRKLGEQLDVKPGAEMIEGINLAKEHGAELVLADRNIEITLKRVWGNLNFWNKLKMASQILAGLLLSEKIDEKMVEELKNKDQLENILETFAESFPEVKRRLIDERDIYLSQKIKNAPGENIVAVVGAGHVKGIMENIHNDIPLEDITKLPPKSIVPYLVGWSIPAVIIALIIYGFFKGGVQHSVGSIYIWIMVNGICSAFGTAIAFAHPLTIITAFFAAPLTSLNPMIAAGWVAGLVQAVVKKPKVSDFENLPVATSSIKGFWLNPVSRILLVVVLANLGSSIGTFVAAGWIAGRLF